MIKRRKIMFAVAVILCMLFGAYGTAAYMSDSRQAINHLKFIGDKGMDAILSEPSWNPENGLMTVPGTVIPKDPQITNVSEVDIDELVAVKCEFVYTSLCQDKGKVGKVLSEEDMEKVLQVYEIDYNSDISGKKEWVRFEKEKNTDTVQHFYYTRTLKRNMPGQGDCTEPLFTRIVSGKHVDGHSQLAVREFGGFEIRIVGMALQQMEGERDWGLGSAKNAYEAGLFRF